MSISRAPAVTTLPTQNPIAAIETRKLTKHYGRVKALNDLTLSVERGECFGYLGPNGAGKTTTLRLLLDFIRPTSGRASILGLDPRRDGVELRRRVGYVPGEFGVYERMTARAFLEFIAGLRAKPDTGHAMQLAERLDVELDRPLGELSRGNKQKVVLIQAFMHDADVLLLDEPTSGLDPIAQEEVHNLIREATSSGRTILLSSHNLPEVQAVCERVGIIRAGRLIATGPIASLKKLALRRFEVTLAKDVHPAAFERVPGIHDLHVRGHRLKCVIRGSVAPFVRTLARYDVVDLISHEPDLEEVFMAHYGAHHASPVHQDAS